MQWPHGNQYSALKEYSVEQILLIAPKDLQPLVNLILFCSYRFVGLVGWQCHEWAAAFSLPWGKKELGNFTIMSQKATPTVHGVHMLGPARLGSHVLCHRVCSWVLLYQIPGIVKWSFQVNNYTELSNFVVNNIYHKKVSWIITCFMDMVAWHNSYNVVKCVLVSGPHFGIF